MWRGKRDIINYKMFLDLITIYTVYIFISKLGPDIKKYFLIFGTHVGYALLTAPKVSFVIIV